MRQFSESDRKFVVWALVAWTILLSILAASCASPEVTQQQHQPVEMEMRPPSQEYCESYLTPEDVAQAMRIINFRSCMESLEHWKSFKP